MEADWDEVPSPAQKPHTLQGMQYVLTAAQLAIAQLPQPGPHHAAVPISTFAFDTTQELLWTGNNHVSA